jgi:hypothetical protein
MGRAKSRKGHPFARLLQPTQPDPELRADLFKIMRSDAGSSGKVGFAMRISHASPVPRLLDIRPQGLSTSPTRPCQQDRD